MAVAWVPVTEELDVVQVHLQDRVEDYQVWGLQGVQGVKHHSRTDVGV